MTFCESYGVVCGGIKAECVGTADYKKHWPVSLACDLLGVSASGFFQHMRRNGADKPSREGANMRLSNKPC